MTSSCRQSRTSCGVASCGRKIAAPVERPLRRPAPARVRAAAQERPPVGLARHDEAGGRGKHPRELRRRDRLDADLRLRRVVGDRDVEPGLGAQPRDERFEIVAIRRERRRGEMDPHRSFVAQQMVELLAAFEPEGEVEKIRGQVGVGPGDARRRGRRGEPHRRHFPHGGRGAARQCEQRNRRGRAKAHAAGLRRKLTKGVASAALHDAARERSVVSLPDLSVDNSGRVHPGDRALIARAGKSKRPMPSAMGSRHRIGETPHRGVSVPDPGRKAPKRACSGRCRVVFASANRRRHTRPIHHPCMTICVIPFCVSTIATNPSWPTTPSSTKRPKLHW